MSNPYSSIDDLRSQLGTSKKPEHSPEYREKMMHPIPQTTEVKRPEFILKHCKDKVVLELGASGPMHEAIKQVAKRWAGIDREDQPDGVMGFDLDDVNQQNIPHNEVPEIIILGEVLEHLSNPGWVLTRLKRQFPGVPMIVTVPNAFANGLSHWLSKGFENVNRDHVAWYSPKTISVLLQRAGYDVGGLFWYNGSGPTAEGLVVVTE